jgi:chromosome segregation ATPase
MSDYGNLQKACQKGSASIADANNLLAECHAALGKLISENERLEYALKLRKDNLTMLRGDVESKDRRIRNHFETIDSLADERDQLKAENETLRTGCSELRGLFADAAEQCCKAEGERDQCNSEITSLTKEADQLHHQCARLRKNSERYCWLRDMHIGNDPESINLDSAVKSGLDAAIDAAMKEQKD